MLNFPVGGNLIPCVPNLQISSFLGIRSVQVTSYWHYRRSEDIAFKRLHKGMPYSFIQFFLKRKFRIKACLFFWNYCLFKAPIYNFLLFLFFSCCCMAAFQNFFVVLWMLHGDYTMTFVLYQPKLYSFGIIFIENTVFLGIQWDYRLEFNFFLGASESLFLRVPSVLWTFICLAP